MIFGVFQGIADLLWLGGDTLRKRYPCPEPNMSPMY
jgi:hypothetical protein